MTGIRLVVDGLSYEGWISVEIERALDDFAQRFSLRYLDRWASDQQPWPIRAGAACTVVYGDETLITGYVNRARFTASGDAWTLSADGRSKTGDLVDCSATHATSFWRNKTASAIASDLVAPFGLSVRVEGADDTQLYPRFGLEEGESVHAALDRLCKVRALVPTTSPGGDVVLKQLGTGGSAILLQTEQAIQHELSEDDSDRFSAYLVRATGVGTVEQAFSKAVASDPAVKRFRPLVVIGDAPAGTVQAKTRAEWERNIRAGRSEKLRYTMPGALAIDGHTYTPGKLYHISDSMLGVDETLVCSRAVLRAAERELVTDIELCRPETYAALSYPKKILTGRTKTGRAIVKKTKRGGGL
jgi:prophage tail gpP-like protein